MIPFGNETVTLVQRTESVVSGKTVVTYSVRHLAGCSWRRTSRIVRNDNALISEESTVCRVPAGQEKPKAGDLLILGRADVHVTSGAEYKELIDRYRDQDGAFVVTDVKDNARPGMPMPHYAARGGS